MEHVDRPEESRRGALGSLALVAAAVAALPARSAHATGQSQMDVKADFGAVGDGVADDTASLQAAANSKASLYFPPGVYRITDTIVLPNFYGLVYSGAGTGRSQIMQATAGKDAFSHSHRQFLISWRDLAILGGPGTGHGIRVNGTIYNCDFTEMHFYMGGSAIYAVNQPVFSTLFTRCEFSSHDSHAIEITGGNTCTFLQCYAIRIPATHYGYRIYSRALMLACNGINTAGGWGLFGQDPREDPVNMAGRITCINCNIEGHTTEGIRFKSDARANFINCTFLAGSDGTYDSHLRIDYGSEMVELVNCTFASSGAVLSAGRTRAISSGATARIKATGCNETEYQSSFGIVKFATESVVPNGNLMSGMGLNSARIGLLSITSPSQDTGPALCLGNTSATNAISGTITPPAQVAGFLVAHLNGKPIRIPYYAV